MSYELRPLTLAEVLDAAFRLVQTQWKTLIGLALIMQVPIVLLGSQISWMFDPFADPFDGVEEPSTEMLTDLGLGVGLLGLAYLLLYPFVAGAVTAAVGNFYLGRQFEIRDAARAGWQSLARLILAYVVYFVLMILLILVVGAVLALLGVLAGSILQGSGAVAIVIGMLGFSVLIFAILYAGSVSALLAPIIVLESDGIFASVRRAFSLAGTAKWRVIGVILTAGIIVGMPIFGAQMLVSFSASLGMIVLGVFQAIGFAFTTSVAVVLYFDIRCRAENYDLELLAEQVEAGPGLGER